MSLRVPLVRVEGKRFEVRPEFTMTPERFAAAAPLSREARDQTARDAESEFGFSPSLYFYAGVAHPAFGDIVLAYEPESSDGLEGGVTTFDTGGMHLGLIKGNFDETSPKVRKTLVANDDEQLNAWRERVVQWIFDYFDTADSYIDGVPKAHADEPTGRIGHHLNERRAWTCEIRLYEDLPLFDNLAFAIIGQDFWLDALASSNVGGRERERLLDLFEHGKIVYVESPENPCNVAVRQIKQYIARGTSS